MGLVSLEEETPESLLSPCLCEPTKKSPREHRVRGTRLQASGQNLPCWPPISDFPASWTMRKKHLLSKPPCLWYFVTAVWTDSDTFQHSLSLSFFFFFFIPHYFTYYVCSGLRICPQLLWQSSHWKVERNSPPLECDWKEWLASSW